MVSPMPTSPLPVSRRTRLLRGGAAIGAALALGWAMVCLPTFVQRPRVGGVAAPFDIVDYGWPCRFMVIDCYDYAYDPVAETSISVPIRREIGEFDGWYAAIDLALWCLLSFAIWKRLHQPGRTFGLSTLFRVIWSLTILICLLQNWGALWWLTYRIKCLLAAEDTSVEEWNYLWGRWSCFPGDVVAVEIILYAGLFIGIDYYTQVLLWCGGQVRRQCQHLNDQ